MKDLKTRFQQLFPDRFFLENDPISLAAFLRSNNWLAPTDEILTLEKPGVGNMNYVLRVKTQQTSFIIKQARPWVEKYPQFDAPIERTAVEARYYETVNCIEKIRPFSPRVLGFDEKNSILLLEDLGEANDFTYLYQKGQQLTGSEIKNLCTYLSALHHSRPSPETEPFPENMAMRKDLNHIHIFLFPFQADNELNLDDIQDGLQAAARPYLLDETLKSRIRAFGELYISPGPTLLHGDFYVGSWLKTANGLKIIDPEFAFQGPAEFEIGVLIAHLYMAEQGEEAIQEMLAHYLQPEDFDVSLAMAFAGIEILRRLIGVAQLPLALSLGEKTGLMKQAAEWISAY